MLDSRLRPLIDPPLNALGARLAALGVTANRMTLIGLALGLAAAVSIAAGAYLPGLALLLLSRLADGLDGAIARATHKSAFGGYLDILCDFAFYAAIPLAFAVAAPENHFPALVLLASFILSGVSFLASAVIAEKQGWRSEAQGQKSFFYMEGLAEGFETIAVLVIACLVPVWFPVLAYGFAVLCVLTAIGRTLRLARDLGNRP
jgi:phosphatidylglycerophosphate synthase